MKRILTYIFGLIIMAAPFAPSTAATPTPTVTVTNASGKTVTAAGPLKITVTGKVQLEKPSDDINITDIMIIKGSTINTPTPRGCTPKNDGSFRCSNVNYEEDLHIKHLNLEEVIIHTSDYPADDINIKDPIILKEKSYSSDENWAYAYPYITDTTKLPEGATAAIIYNPNITGPKDVYIDKRGADQDYKVICQCDKEHILMKDNKAVQGSIKIQGTNEEGEVENITISFNSATDQNICAPAAYTNERTSTQFKYRFSLAKTFGTNGPQCIKKTNCHNQNEVGVKESEYKLNTQTNEYTCNKTCETGYKLNENRNKCEVEDECEPDASTHPQAATGKYVGEGSNRKCVPSSCKCGYKLEQQNTANASCTEWDPNTCSNRTKIRGAASMKRFCNDETEICHAISCNDGYELVSVTDHNYTLPSGINPLQTCQSHERKCTDDERSRYTTHHGLKEWPTNTIKKETAINFDNNGARICIPTKCECGYDLKDAGKKDAKCEQWTANMPCDQKPEHATDNKYHRACRNGNEYCHIEECEGDYKPNNRNDACVGKRGECTPTNPSAQHHDKIWDSKYKTVKGVRKCVITKCATGYEPNEDGSDCTPLTVLSKEDSEARINELKGVYKDARDNETSAANKALGAASMAATGAGGMMLAMGLSEQKADKEAEEKMRGYVATFKCNYGNTNVEYSTQPTELPMSTELYNLYAEYVTLANDLKLRKEMLGLRAGIESEKILDSATTGLYDDVSSGRSAGMYTSLARAILDPNGADAAAWAEQTKRSKNLIIAGATTAGVGVVGSIVGNKLINKDAITLSKVKESIKGINARYQDRVLYDSWTDLEAQAHNQEKKCSEFVGVSEETKNKKVSEGCKCENPLFTFNANNGGCHCGLTNHVVKDMSDSNCACAENATRNGNVCTCNTNYNYNNKKQECIANTNAAATSKPQPEPAPEKLCNEFVGVSEATKNKKVSEGCKCENPLFTFNANNGGCHCGLTNHVVKDMSDSNCACAENATQNGNVCTCATNYRYNSDTKTCDVDEKALRTLTLSGSMFKTNLDTLQTERLDALATTSNLINDWLNSNTEDIQYCFQISGHTDRVPTSRRGGNPQLSEDRAKTVANFLIERAGDKQATLKAHIRIKGFGEEQCTQDGSQETCRKVEIEHTLKACPNDDGWKSLP